jgi:hypothetical protein
VSSDIVFVLKETPTKFWRIPMLSNRFRFVVVEFAGNRTVLTVGRKSIGQKYESLYTAYSCRESKVRRNGYIPASKLAGIISRISLLMCSGMST